MRDPTNAYNECTPVLSALPAQMFDFVLTVLAVLFQLSQMPTTFQDIWQVTDRLTLELGLRNESFENMNADGGVFVEVTDQWAPRLAAVYDPTGEGRSKFFANYGEYYLPIAANTNIRMAGNETYIQDYYDWDGVSVGAQEVPTNLGGIYNSDVFGDGTVPDTRSVTDGNIQAMFQRRIHHRLSDYSGLRS